MSTPLPEIPDLADLPGGLDEHGNIVGVLEEDYVVACRTAGCPGEGIHTVAPGFGEAPIFVCFRCNERITDVVLADEFLADT